MNFPTRYIILIATLLVLGSGTISGQFYWENADIFSTRSGLPNNSILSVYQDSRGYLWIGTYNGLCRYDGHDFKVYKSERSAKASWILSVNTICEDRDGNILIGTRGGVIGRLDRKSEKWKHFNVKTDVVSICIDEEGKKWFATRNGLIGRIEDDTTIIVSRTNFQVSGLAPFDAHNLILLSHETSLYNKRENKFTDLVSKLGMPQLPEATLASKTHIFFFYRNDHVTSYHIETAKKHHLIIPKEFGFNITRDPVAILSNGNIAVITKTGIIEMDAEGKILGQIHLGENAAELNRNFVNTIYEDNSDLIWIGTNAGLFKIDKRRAVFKKFNSTGRVKHLKHNYVRSLYTRQDELWVGTRFGEVGKLVIDTGTGNTLSETWFGARINDQLIDHNYTVNALTGDKNGNIWAGGNGILFLRKGDTEFRRCMPISAETYTLGDIWSLCFINEHELLIGTAKRGMFILNTHTKELQNCILNGAEKISVWNIFRSSDGRIWVGTSKGIYLARKRDDGNFTLQLFDKPITGLTIHKDIWSIAEDKYGNVWFGSTNEGVFCLEKSGAFRRYSIEDGLADNVTSSIIPDKNGNIWVSTINGLSRFDVTTRKFTNYSEEDGLVSNDFNFKASAYSTWGEIFLGSKVGITAFYPEQVTFSTHEETRAELTSIKIEGMDYPFDPATDTILLLDHSRNDISFNFALLEYRRILTHTYRYKLKGFNKQWQYTSYSNPAATYTNLPPGEYEFIVQASADGKSWSNEVTSLQISISPALWQRPFTWVGSGFIILLAAGIGMRSRIRFLVTKEREKARVQKAMAELEMKALRAQMNPHFIFNAVTAIQHYIVNNDILQANEYLSRFARLMRLFLESSRYKYTSLAKEIEMLHLYISLEKLRFDEKFDYKIKAEERINAEELDIPSMLLQPFVENAINHGLMYRESKGLLQVEFNLNEKENLLSCIIDDNGIGREQAAAKRKGQASKHISLGTKIVEERVQSFLDSDDLKITVKVKDRYTDQGEVNGTRVEVMIPLTKKTVLLNENAHY